jgi:tetratricopeptide (TPR) repeat protein
MSSVINNYHEELNMYRNRKAHAINLARIEELVNTAESVIENQGNISVAVKQLKKAIRIYDKLSNNDNKFFDKAVRILNAKSVSRLSHEKDGEALYMLRQAEGLIRGRPTYDQWDIISSIYNNMSLGLRKHSFLDLALDYLQKAQGVNFRHSLKTGLTDLNVATLFSMMGQ